MSKQVTLNINDYAPSLGGGGFNPFGSVLLNQPTQDPEFRKGTPIERSAYKDIEVYYSQKAFENIGVFLSRKNELTASNLALSMHYYIGVMNNYARELRAHYIKFIDEYEK